MTEEEVETEDHIIEKKLFLREEDTIKKLSLLLDRLQSFVRVEKVSGKIVFEKPNLSLKDKLFCALAAHYFWSKVNKLEDYSKSLTELSGIVAKPVTSLSGPISELVRDGFVEKISSGKYRVAYYSIEKFLDHSQ